MTGSSSRLVRANQIISPALPPVHVSVDPSFTYVGGPHFQLYEIAQAEQHLFVITQEQQTVHQLLWVQFEGYLPDNQRSYHYPVTQTVTLAGYPFIYDTFVFDVEREVAQRPDSDLAAAHQFLQAAGYDMAGEVRAQRFVYLVEPEKRNELMIIYGECSGKSEAAPLENALEQALASFTVRFQ